MMPGLDPARLVFLDETRASTRTARTLGRAPRGERLIATVPHGRWHITTFVGALRRGGFTAPPVVEGAMNGPTFLAYVRQFLAPALAPGGVVVMDNLSAHKVPGVREAIEAGGAALLYLPPYSPDLTRSNSPSASSRASCGRPRNAPPRPSGGPSVPSSAASAPRSAPPTSFRHCGLPPLRLCTVRLK
jgi:hypothetical protein